MPITLDHFPRIKMGVFESHMRRRQSSVLADDEKIKFKKYFRSQWNNSCNFHKGLFLIMVNQKKKINESFPF